MDALLDISMKSIQTTEYVLSLSIFANAVTTVVFAVWYYKLIKPEALPQKQEVTFRKPSAVKTAFAVILLAIGCQYALSFLVEIIAVAIPSWLVIYMQAMETIGLNGAGLGQPTIPLFIYTVILAPFMEELAFRGIVITYGIRSSSFWAANISSAVLFGVIHGNPLQGVYAVVFGLILGYVFLMTRKVSVTIAIHMLFNAIPLFVPGMVITGNNPIQTFGIVLTSLIVVYFGLTIISREYRKE